MTIDPPGSRDLDQAMHIERRDGGHRVRYAIADVGARSSRPAGRIDRETPRRGVTVYAPDVKAPLHPPVLSEGAASLLPGQWRPAVLWTLDLDAAGELTRTDVVAGAGPQRRPAHLRRRARRARARCCAEVGERRLALERARGGVRLDVPEQEVVAGRRRLDGALPRRRWRARSTTPRSRC